MSLKALHGCKERLPRGEMSLHMKYSATAHESLKVMGTFAKRLRKQEKEIQELETKLFEKHKNLMREQKALFDAKVSSAVGSVNSTLRNLQKSITHLESIERRLIRRDTEFNQELVTLQRRIENLLASRQDLDECLLIQLFSQRVEYTLRFRALEINNVSIIQRLRRKFIAFITFLVIVLFLVILYSITSF